MLRQQEISLSGCAVSKGVAIGIPFILDTADDKVPEIKLSPKDVHAEITRYRKALEKSREDILRLKMELAREGITDGASVLEAHLQMIEDPLLNNKIEEEIKVSKKNAEYVFKRAIQRFKKKFNSLQDPFFQQRFEDVHDISKRVLAYLREMKRTSFADIPQNSIVFTHSLTPSDAAEARIQNVGAFVTQVGGTTSHTAIVAKAKGIPYVSSVNFSKLPQVSPASMCIVDGMAGKIILNPTEKTLIHYRQQKLLIQRQHDFLKTLIGLPSITLDGLQINLSANVEIADNFTGILEHGADGVGLFRSEYIVLQRGFVPSEDEQFEIYKQLVMALQGKPVVIRAFDIGLDKVACSIRGMNELNPALGLRAIRFLLQEKELLKSQLRAILRASQYGEVRVLFPMISSLNELKDAKAVLAIAYEELKEEGCTFAQKIKIGCMIEVPSAAMIVDLIAKECDFLSIGTNDLIQYALAVDRMNQSTSAFYTSTHPGVVRLMKTIIQEAIVQSIPVSVCGEIASDPRFIPLLIGLGITDLSVSCRYLPVIRHVVRATNMANAKRLADKVLLLKTADEIHDVLVQEYEKNIPAGSIDHV